MTLTDAGALIALIDAGEPDHDRCRETLEKLELPLLTTWPAFTEAIYLLGQVAGWPGQRALWAMIRRSALILADLDLQLALRSAELMDRYRDHPMDLADATLVALAETRDLRTIFTLDEHFRTYRLANRRYLHVVPS
ncbi:MAG TPA: PIN domain-containing protein [Solirubrobacteraceae bacterium]|nr:PIN domain-containing protein [Solirubrobacteraceae bacterium]